MLFGPGCYTFFYFMADIAYHIATSNALDGGLLLFYGKRIIKWSVLSILETLWYGKIGHIYISLIHFVRCNYVLVSNG